MVAAVREEREAAEQQAARQGERRREEEAGSKGENEVAGRKDQPNGFQTATPAAA